MARKNQTPDVTFTFTPRDNGPESLVADVEAVFHAGVFAGLKLVGFSIWRSNEGDAFVSFPSRSYAKADGQRRWLDFLRVAHSGNGATKRLKEAILEAWKVHEAEQADQAPKPNAS